MKNHATAKQGALIRRMRSCDTAIRKMLWGAIIFVAFFAPMGAFCQTDYIR